MAVKPVPMASEGRRDPKSKKNSYQKASPSQSYGTFTPTASFPKETPLNLVELQLNVEVRLNWGKSGAKMVATFAVALNVKWFMWLHHSALTINLSVWF